MAIMGDSSRAVEVAKEWLKENRPHTSAHVAEALQGVAECDGKYFITLAIKVGFKVEDGSPKYVFFNLWVNPKDYSVELAGEHT